MPQAKELGANDLTQEDWEVLKNFLPRGWKEKAKELGAISRLRNFKDSDSLLRENHRVNSLQAVRE